MFNFFKPQNLMRKLVLVILDGWGIADPGNGNAIELAKKPFFDSLINSYPHTFLTASGEAVGLPENEAGNSEVGHLNLGAGRIVLQDVTSIDRAIEDGSFFRNERLIAAFAHVKRNQSNLHIMGLV